VTGQSQNTTQTACVTGLGGDMSPANAALAAGGTKFQSATSDIQAFNTVRPRSTRRGGTWGGHRPLSQVAGLPACGSVMACDTIS
jgi:hypothetical protein